VFDQQVIKQVLIARTIVQLFELEGVQSESFAGVHEKIVMLIKKRHIFIIHKIFIDCYGFRASPAPRGGSQHPFNNAKKRERLT
jgi:hypothetical protein